MSRMIIKRISATDFKGASNVSYEFGPNLNIMLGPNGSGKTTVADAFHYGMTGKDYAMTANPVITPNNKPADAAETQVSIKGEIDGKPIEIIRSQKTRFSKPDANGVRKTTTVNTYTINSVTMSERDAVKRFAEYGIDMDIFTVLSHPAMFVSQAMGDKKSKDKARAVIFSMANPLPDIEIAKKADVPELRDELEKYTLAEIAEMQKATRRKILAEYGKNGEILLAKIASAESMRVHFDETVMSERKAELEQKKADWAKELAEKREREAERASLITKRIDLYDGLIAKRQEANKENLNALFNIKEKLAKKTNEVAKARNKTEDDERKLADLDKRIASLKADLGRLNESLEAKKALVFDEKTTVCPTCKRPYEKEKADAIRAEFEEAKAETVKAIEDAIAKATASLTAAEDNKALGEKILKADKEKVEALKSEARVFEGAIKEIPENIDETKLPEYPGIKAEIDKINERIAVLDEEIAKAESLKDMISRATDSIAEIEKREAQMNLNKAIDAKIEEYRSQQVAYEQMLADTEKIDAQIALFGRTKNELLTESINAHFKVVKWKLFDYQKNGEYKECLIPMIGSTPYDSLSGGEKMVAMVDIVTSLQKWYDTYLPVFIDEAGIATAETLEKVKDLANTQLILLTAKDTEGGKVIVEAL